MHVSYYVAITIKSLIIQPSTKVMYNINKSVVDDNTITTLYKSPILSAKQILSAHQHFQ